jgi:hypothetical protein
MEKSEKKKSGKKRKDDEDLPIITKTYSLIAWYVPILNRLPRDHKFALGDRIINNLYTVLEQLILARYEKNKAPRLEALNGRLDVLRHQTRLMKEFDLIELARYGQASKLINEIGTNLGSWIKYLKQGANETTRESVAASD